MLMKPPSNGSLRALTRARMRKSQVAAGGGWSILKPDGSPVGRQAIKLLGNIGRALW